MQRWIENGAAFGWLIDPCKKLVYVYHPGSEVSVESCLALSGTGPLNGFILNLDELWRCYEL